MVAAIQAAKNQLEVDKSKRPPSSSQPNNSPLHHQRSKSFTNTITNTNTNISNNSPLPPTNIVSFNPKSSNNNNSNTANNTNQPIALNRSVSDTAAAAHPYHNNSNTNNRGNHELDYIHPDYQYSDSNDNCDNDTITSSLSGTLPEYNSTSSCMRRSSSHSGLGIGSSGGGIQATAAATIQPALTKDHLKHLPAQSAQNIDAAFSSKMNLLPPLNNSTNSNANSTVDGQLNRNDNNNAQQQQVNNSINNNANNNNNIKQSEKESTNNNTKGRTVEEIMSAYQGKVDTILNKRDHNNHGGSSTSVGSRGSNNNNSSTSLGAALATLNTSQQQYTLSSSKSVGNNNNNNGENRTTFNASKSVGNPTTSITSSGVVDLSISSPSSKTSGGESKIDDILSTYKQKVGEIMAKSNNTNNNNNQPYHHNLDDSDKGYNTDDNGGTTTRSVISRQPSLAVDNVILDDEESIGSNREAALDYDNRRDSGAGSYKSCNSGSRSGSDQGSQGSDLGGSQGSYHSREEDSRERSDMLMTSEATTLNNDMMAFNNNNVISNKVKDHLGGMSERANAILQSINNNNSKSNNSNLGGDNSTNPENDDNHSSENRTRSNSEASTQSNGAGEEEGSYDNDSYISGASSASELSSQIEGAAYGYHDNRPPQGNFPLNESEDPPPPQAQLDTSPIRRKDTHDSLQRAQAAISSPIKSSSTSAQQQQQTNTTGDTIDATSDRKYRQDLEKKVSEATQREMEYTQLETKLKEAQSQLDTLQAQARTTKYSSSEQASRIKDLERKLKNEKENNAELKRERDAMKDEYDQDLEEQKDINRQLEQMVMSEEFEKELEDEINQVKELEHANRRFKVKIDSKCMRYVCFCAHLVSLYEKVCPCNRNRITHPRRLPHVINSA